MSKGPGAQKAWLMTEPEAISVAHGVIDRASTGTLSLSLLVF